MSFRYLTAGESHGPELGVIVEGMPAGVPLTEVALAASSAACSLLSGSDCITRVQFSQSRFSIKRRIGEPMVRP